MDAGGNTRRVACLIPAVPLATSDRTGRLKLCATGRLKEPLRNLGVKPSQLRGSQPIPEFGSDQWQIQRALQASTWPAAPRRQKTRYVQAWALTGRRQWQLVVR